MLKLDHLAIIAPSLEAGRAHVQERLGIDMPAGGKHPQMGTHNLLLRLGDDVFLEVIAADPAAASPPQPRWFGLDDSATVQADWAAERRLRTWVARTDDLDAVRRQHGPAFGEKAAISRGDLSWHFLVRGDGALPADGVAPSIMDWGARGNPASAMPDLGARLLSFGIEHPDPERVATLYAELGIANPPEIHKGTQFRYRARIETPGGIRELF